MKKINMFRKVIFTVFLLLAVFGEITKVSATTISDTITIDRVINLSSYNTPMSVHYKEASGNFIYCIEANKSNLYTDDVLKLDGTIDDNGVVYLIKNGYPNTSMTGDNKKDYFITQVAIWWYYQSVYGVEKENVSKLANSSYDDVEVVKYIRKLYNGALKAHDADIVNPSLKLSGNSKLTLSSDKNYYQSELVAVNLNGASDYTVAIDNNQLGFVITDLDGNVRNTFKDNEKFMIRIETDEIKNEDISVTVKVNASGTIDKVYKYAPTVSSKQKGVYGALVSTVIPLEETISFNYELVDVEFSKIDITTEKELAGATLEVRDSNNNLIESWVSTTETHTIKLKPGKYTLTETIAPKGYEKATTSVEFTVYENGTVDKIIITNVPITDLDASKSVVLVGSTFVLFGMGLVIKNVKGKKEEQ